MIGHVSLVLLYITTVTQSCEVTVPCPSNKEGVSWEGCEENDNLFECVDRAGHGQNAETSPLSTKRILYTNPNKTAPKATIKTFKYDPCVKQLKLKWCDQYFYVQTMIEQYNIEVLENDFAFLKNYTLNITKGNRTSDIDTVCFSMDIDGIEQSNSNYTVYIWSSNVKVGDNSLKDTTATKTTSPGEVCNPPSDIEDDFSTTEESTINITNSTKDILMENYQQKVVTMIVSGAAILIVVSTIIVLIWSRRRGSEADRNPIDSIVVLISTAESADSIYMRAAHDLSQALTQTNAFTVYFNAWEKENITIFGIHGWLRRVVQTHTKILLIGSKTLSETLAASLHADHGMVETLRHNKHATAIYLDHGCVTSSLIHLKSMKFPEDFLQYNKDVLHSKLHVYEAREIVKTLAIYAAKIERISQSKTEETSLLIS